MVFPTQAIVCAVDFSPFCSLVCDYGASLARRAGCRLYLFHAIHHPQDRVHPTAVFERGGDLDLSMENARRRMHRLMETVSVDWEAVVRFGDPVEQIAAVMGALPPGLVVSASHGVSGFRRFLIGTVVERLSRTLDCPMLVVKPAGNGRGEDQTAGFRSVVVSCDGNGYWHRLGPLLGLLQPDPASPIHLVHAMERPLVMPRDDPTVSDSYANAQQATQEHLSHRFRQQARQLFRQDKVFDTLVAPGVPQDMALRVAREQRADLIVVGVRPSGRMGRLISGSTTEALLRHSDCSVLTLPEPKGPADATGGRQ